MNTRFEHVYVLNVLADDRPGIVAAVGKAVGGMGGNIDAISQTVLSGYFTLIMLVSFPEAHHAGRLAEAVRDPATGVEGLQVMVRPMELPDLAPAESGDRFVITAVGEDKPGIVLRFSQYLAGKDINIIDLFGDLRGGEFVLISQVQIPGRWEISMLQSDLEEMGREEGFAVRLQHENIFVATNQLRLTPSK
jgi:glycine cleavage system transcriptional repressor